ncbi:MAG: GNAT family N-acetyltransferase, partial [Paludibacter sp.]
MQINVHKSVCEINTNQWDELINHSSTASFFQTKECYDFYASLSFMQAFVFGVSENDKLVGVLCGYVIADGNFVKRYFSRRAIVPGGVLIDANISDKALQTLLDYAKNELSHKAIYIEIRNYNDYS